MSGKHRAGTVRPLKQQAPNVSWTIETYYTERLMSVKEVAATLGRSERTIRKWIRDGEIIPVGGAPMKRPGTRGRKGLYFTLSDIEHCRKDYTDHA